MGKKTLSPEAVPRIPEHQRRSPGYQSSINRKERPVMRARVFLGHHCSSFFPIQVLEDQQNIRLIRELLQTLYTSLCTLVQRVGKSVLVGNINMWVYRMETILHWQQQLNNIRITRVSGNTRLPPRRKRLQSQIVLPRLECPLVLEYSQLLSSDAPYGLLMVGWGTS